MPKRPHAKIKECYQHAKRCRDLAFLSADNPFLMAEYLAMEEKWIKRAQDYATRGAVFSFTRKVKDHLTKHG